MKHILIACLVFALCLAVGLFSLFYVRASGEETVTLLERSIRQAEEEQYTAAAESLRQAKQLWKGRETVLGIFLHHEEVDEILALFAQLEAFICHSNCLADAEATKAAVEAAFPHLNGEVRICDIGTIVASHSGPGTVAVFFFGDDRAPEGSAV